LGESSHLVKTVFELKTVNGGEVESTTSIIRVSEADVLQRIFKNSTVVGKKCLPDRNYVRVESSKTI
jgi:hypothetical protein